MKTKRKSALSWQQGDPQFRAYLADAPAYQRRIEAWELTLPVLTRTQPDTVHWRVRQNDTHAVHRLIATTVPRSALPSEPLERAHLTLIRRSDTQPDFEGLVLGFKGIVDSFSKRNGGLPVLRDDSPTHTTREYRWEKAKRGHGSLTIRIEALQCDTP